MKEPTCDLREQELAFFGKIGADVSHQMRNVLAIVGENAGLLDDQLARAWGRKVPDLEKLKKVAERIARQVNKGVEIMERFSRFAHAADEQNARLDLTALVEDVALLVRRHVRHSGGNLEAALPDHPVQVTTNPSCLQHVLFRCLQMVLQHAQESVPVTVGLSSRESSATLKVSGTVAPESNELPDCLSELTVALNELEASVETCCENGTLSLVLTLPTQHNRMGES
jgi:nitrogen fixation/metabolism regulation signal transduction histidine kinase